MAVPILWRNRKQRYSLEGAVCSECDRTVFPPRPVCPYCSRETTAVASVDAPVAASVDLGLIMDLPEFESAHHCDDACHANEDEAQETNYPHQPLHERVEYAFVWPSRRAHSTIQQAGDD